MKNLLFFSILIILTAFFVASEFAIVRVRKTRIDQMIEEGNQKAERVRTLLQNLDGYLSACQLGITITSLGLGWIGEPTFRVFIEPFITSLQLPESATRMLAFFIVFGLVTFLHVVIGELTPKTIAIQQAERISLFIAKPLHFFYIGAFPIIWFLNGSARLLTRLFGMKPIDEFEKALTEEELRLSMSESYKGGEINQYELQYVNRIFEFDDRLAREIMVPRTEIVCVYRNDSFEDNLATLKGEKFTRFPVADDDKDHIIGLINLKELYRDLLNNDPKPFHKYIRPIITVIEHIPIKKLLIKMQKEQVYMAILVDEYGGTAGLVTVEDIVEEIVGEIRDEFDNEEKSKITKVNDSITILDSKLLIEEVNDLFDLELDHSELDTIGGWMLTKVDKIKLGSTITIEQYEFKITEVDGHQIKSIEVTNLTNK